jgi:hypothetical protein
MTTLTQLLTAELRWCQKHRGRANQRVITLPKGLSLVLYVDEEGANHILARRLAPQWPSENEVQTVLRHWPQQPTPQVQVRLAFWKTYNCLYFSWKPVTPPFGGRGGIQ